MVMKYKTPLTGAKTKTIAKTKQEQNPSPKIIIKLPHELSPTMPTYTTNK